MPTGRVLQLQLGDSPSRIVSALHLVVGRKWMSPSATLSCYLLLTYLASSGGQPVYKVGNYKDVPITSINAQTKRFGITPPFGGGQSMGTSPKTWFLKDNQEATFTDLKVGQRVSVWFIPRGAQ